MTAYVSVRDALIRDIESAEAALMGADQVYAEVERELRKVQNSASRAYDGRATNQRTVDRLKKALAIIEGEGDERPRP